MAFTPDTTDLCTGADLELFMSQLAPGNPDEARLQRLITALSASMRNLLGRSDDHDLAYAATITEVRDGGNKNSINMYRYPVWSVASLTVDGFSIPASTGPTTFGYNITRGRKLSLQNGARPTGSPAVPGGGPSYFNRGIQNVTVVYSAGYWLPSMTGTRPSMVQTLPADLRQAVAEWVALRYKQSKRWGNKDESVGMQRISFDMSAVPDSVKDAVRNYQDTSLFL